jgi:hypothetical protein
MALGLAGTWGYHGLPPAAYTRYWNWCLTAGSVEGMAVLNVGWLATGGVPPPTWRRVATATSRDGDPLVIAENPDPPLRAWLAPTVVPVPDVEAALAQVMAPGWNRSRVPVEGVAGPFPAGPRMGVIAPVWQRESLEADVIVPTASVMVLSEAWSPAWQAFLDGRRVRVLRAYGILRAVAVPAGRHRLVMRYESWLLKIGLWLTLAGMALLLADRVMDSA